MNIQIQLVPHKKQRYNTVGDWLFDIYGNLDIKISELGDDDYTFLIAIHELIEAYLCKGAGIDQNQVDKFDMEFTGQDPGQEKTAPYYTQHIIATFVESAIAACLGVNWEEYEKEINLISQTYE